MTYGSACWAVKKKDENKLNPAKMRMLRWARGKTRLDHIRNEDIRKEAQVKPVEPFLENKRLKWFDHCLRRERNHICAKLLGLEVSGRRSRGRPKKRWRDNIQGDMKKYQLTEVLCRAGQYFSHPVFSILCHVLKTWHKIENTGWLKYWPALHKEMVKKGER